MELHLLFGHLIQNFDNINKSECIHFELSNKNERKTNYWKFRITSGDCTKFLGIHIDPYFGCYGMVYVIYTKYRKYLITMQRVE